MSARKKTRAEHAAVRAKDDLTAEPGTRRRHGSFELHRDDSARHQLSEQSLEPGMLVDQGDGVRVSHRDSEPLDDETDLPDKPPPGWCDV